MNQLQPSGWDDLSAQWRDDPVAFAAADIQRRRRRAQKQLFFTTVVELAVAALGVVAALWQLLAGVFPVLGVATSVCVLWSAAVMFRARHAAPPAGTGPLLDSLKDSIEHEDWMAEQLRLGRALGFMALFAIVMAASVQLLSFRPASVPQLWATATAGFAVSAALAWNFVLAWQARRRGAGLRSIAEKLRA
jgi:hypothetical protein